MQKVWKQIGMQLSKWMKLEHFMEENHIITYGDAILELFEQNERYKTVIASLEKLSNEAEEWKIRAEAHLKPKKKEIKKK